MITKLTLPCPPASINNESTVLKGRQVIGTFDSLDYPFGSNASTFDLGSLDDVVFIQWHLDPYPRNQRDWDLYLITDRPFDVSSCRADQWSGQFTSPVRSHALIPTTWIPGNAALTLSMDPADAGELHTATNVLYITLNR